MLQITLGPDVGVAPGTTTLCYGTNNNGNGLGVCPPGHYGPAVMLPGSSPVPGYGKGPAAAGYWNPYGSEMQMKGLRGVTRLRWDLFALMLGLGFAAVIGYALIKKR